MSWSVDYSDSWQFVDGVTDGTIYPPASNTGTAVKVRSDLITHRELAGGAFGITPTDSAFHVWLATPLQEGRLVIGSVSYTVLSVEPRPDGAYCRVLARKRV